MSHPVGMSDRVSTHDFAGSAWYTKAMGFYAGPAGVRFPALKVR
ncbi:MAG TPA: hypothetical protein VI072_21505 [Polyangiaceae bacterium]